MVTSIVFSIAYGKQISNMDDEYVVVAEKAVIGASKTLPGEFWVEYFPFIKHLPTWIPGTRSRKFAEEYLPYVVNMRDKPYQDIKTAVVSVFETPSIRSYRELM